MNSKGLRPSLSVVAHGESLVSTAGGVLLCQTARLMLAWPRCEAPLSNSQNTRCAEA